MTKEQNEQANWLAERIKECDTYRRIAERGLMCKDSIRVTVPGGYDNTISFYQFEKPVKEILEKLELYFRLESIRYKKIFEEL